jgi:ferritin-like metal-binding protein YciE
MYQALSLNHCCFTVFIDTSENQMKLETLHDLYLDELKDLYSAENQLLKALPKMAAAATSPQLAKAFTDHLEETKGQVDRLEQIFQKLEINPKGKNCKAMEGLLEEGKEVLTEDADPTVRDAALIAAAQRVEHYEMAGYGCVRTYSRLLGYEDATRLLQETFNEEVAADKKLTKLADSVINLEAIAAGSKR